MRLGVRTNRQGASSLGGAAGASIATLGGATAPGRRTDQVWYRNSAAFCTSAPFNLSNGLAIDGR